MPGVPEMAEPLALEDSLDDNLAVAGLENKPLPRPKPVQGRRKQIAKVLQGDLCAALLLQRIDSGAFVTIKFAKPCHLIVMDSATGETLHESFSRWWDDEQLRMALQECESVTDIGCLDSAASNKRWDRSMHHGRPHDFNGYKRITLWCDQHKLFTSLGSQFCLVPSTISGIINTTLAAQPGGAVDKLRFAVECFASARIVVYFGAEPPSDPTIADEREAFLHVFVMNGSYGCAGVVNAFMWRRLLNGDLHRKGVLEHYCPPGCHTSIAAARRDIQTHVGKMFVPRNLEMFSRARWVGSDRALDCVCLLSVNDMQEEVIPAWLHTVSDADFVLTPEYFMLVDKDRADGSAICVDDDDNLGPRGFSGDADPKHLGAQKDLLRGQHLDHFLGDEDPMADSSLPRREDGSVDWNEFNRRARTDSKAFNKQRPGPVTRAVRVSLGPMYTAVSQCLFMASETSFPFSNL